MAENEATYKKYDKYSDAQYLIPHGALSFVIATLSLYLRLFHSGCLLFGVSSIIQRE